MRLRLFLAFLCIANLSSAQTTLQKQLVSLTQVIQLTHYAPRQVDDEFSAQVFERVLKTLDAYNLYFTQVDVTSLEIFRDHIDDEMRGAPPAFSTQLAILYKNRLLRTRNLLDQLQKQPFVLNTPDVFYKGADQKYPVNETAFEQRMRQYFKMRILEYLVAQATEDSVAITPEWITKKEPAARNNVIEKSKLRIDRFLADGYQQRIDDAYLQTISSNFDPHTNFFESEEKDAFKQDLSSESYKFGFSFSKDAAGKYRISGLTPGGAAWKTGKIHKNDEVIAIQPVGDSVTRMEGTNADLMIAALENPSLKRITLTLRSADGLVKAVVIQKQKQQNEENIVRGFVLNGAEKVGYISLPSFYTEWDNNGSSSCANDIAKEIVKLKKEKIGGLILDLRYNGGGSLQEALELIGIFVDVGPGCIIKDRTGKAIVLKDPNRGTIYDGPLIVMINGQSASASEMVAGTLQDYQRALIVGSNSFGKATMQSFFPLDLEAGKTKRASAQYGYVKVTEGKLYRITGKTAQLIGVTPDIALPDAFDAADQTERSLTNALPADTIMKKLDYTLWAGYRIPQLLSKSQTRVSAADYFKSIVQSNSIQKEASAADRVPLQWQDYIKWDQMVSGKLLKETSKTKAYRVDNSSFNAGVTRLDEYMAEMDELVKAGIEVDKYIEEAFLIVNDIIQNPDK